MRLYETSSLFASAESDGFEQGAAGAAPSSSPNPALTMRESGTVYDLAWYPLMSSSMPSTCCFLSTCHKNPTHLWDAFTGKLRATYRSYDYADEITAALSVAFSGNGDKIICGFDRHIRIFDVGYPGRDYETRALIKTVGGRRGQKRRKMGQRGLISCIDATSLYGGLYACGSYAGSTYVYEENSGKTICSLDAHRNGVTKVKFAPDAVRLWTGGRRDDVIIEWDLRMLKILRRYERRCGSNQRFNFDISPNDGGRFLLTGSQSGDLFIYDTLRASSSSPTPTATAAKSASSNPAKQAESDAGDTGDDADDADDAKMAREKPLVHLKGLGDAVNSVSFHPSFSQQFPYFAACTGERKFWLSDFDQDDDDDDDDDRMAAIPEKDRKSKESRKSTKKAAQSAVGAEEKNSGLDSNSGDGSILSPAPEAGAEGSSLHGSPNRNGTQEGKNPSAATAAGTDRTTGASAANTTMTQHGGRRTRVVRKKTPDMRPPEAEFLVDDDGFVIL
mmetsp:Transcript_6685/g.9261  ORF Transcript_6685/g.9261 Transcript_6685/m.9261 type:complete len:504 (+) Transcript_6685:970-2481(+)